MSAAPATCRHHPQGHCDGSAALPPAQPGGLAHALLPAETGWVWGGRQGGGGGSTPLNLGSRWCGLMLGRRLLVPVSSCGYMLCWCKQRVWCGRYQGLRATTHAAARHHLILACRPACGG